MPAGRRHSTVKPATGGTVCRDDERIRIHEYWLTHLLDLEAFLVALAILLSLALGLTGSSSGRVHVHRIGHVGFVVRGRLRARVAAAEMVEGGKLRLREHPAATPNYRCVTRDLHRDRDCARRDRRPRQSQVCPRPLRLLSRRSSDAHSLILIITPVLQCPTPRVSSPTRNSGNNTMDG